LIYLKSSDGQHIVILEPGNLEALKAGRFERAGDGAVLVGYTPDAVWLGEQIFANIDALDPATLQRLITESQKRPEVKERPYHPTFHAGPGKGRSDA
jgi:hypothetical protein